MAYKHAAKTKGDPILSADWNRMGKALAAVTAGLENLQAESTATVKLQQGLIAGLEEKVRGLETRLGDLTAPLLGASEAIGLIAGLEEKVRSLEAQLEKLAEQVPGAPKAAEEPAAVEPPVAPPALSVPERTTTPAKGGAKTAAEQRSRQRKPPA